MNQSVGIQAMAMNCALGNELGSIWQHAVDGHSPGMKNDTRWVSTVVGHATAKPHPLAGPFDTRINQLILTTLASIDNQWQALVTGVDPKRVGVVLGTSTSAVDVFENALAHRDLKGQWPDGFQPHFQRMACVSEFLAQHLAVSGPCLSISTACSSSAKAIITAKNWLNMDLCDVVIAGGVDVLCQLTLRGFDALGALSHQPTLPMSQNRNGINIGEGCALFALTKDGAEINVLGGGSSSDAHHISAPDPTGKGAIQAMSLAIQDAGIKASQIDYVNLHGTGTQQNDAMESKAVNQVFGHSVRCSSSKGLMGHTLGAAGALELGLTTLSMSNINKQNSYIPHVFDGKYDETLDPLNLVNVGNQLGKPRFALSNSFAFGGSNAALILGRAHA